MPDIFKYLVQRGGGAKKKACVYIDLFPYTLCRKCMAASTPNENNMLGSLNLKLFEYVG